MTNCCKGGVDTYLQVSNAQTAALQNERNGVDILQRPMDASVPSIEHSAEAKRYGITERSELVLASEKRSEAWSTDNWDIQD